jgi:hypothetical protein
LTGITRHVHGTEPNTNTSANKEAADLMGSANDGVSVPAPQFPRPSQNGSKVAGATSTKGGAI